MADAQTLTAIALVIVISIFLLVALPIILLDCQNEQSSLFYHSAPATLTRSMTKIPNVVRSIKIVAIAIA